MQLDDWVLCRIYKKKNLGRSSLEHQPIKVEDSFSDHQMAAANDHDDQNQNQYRASEEYKFPRTYSLSHLWEFENYMGSSISQLINDNSSYNVNVGFNNNNQESDNGGFSRAHEKLPLGSQAVPHSSDSTKSHVHQTTFVNPAYNNGFQL